MKRIQSFSLYLICAVAVSAQETVSEYSWEKERGKPASPLATLAAEDGRACLKITSTNAARTQVPLISITNPAVTARFYGLTGEVKYDLTEGSAYLEMWNGFGTNRYFTRALGEIGPMRKISGKSGWRPFILPFDRSGAADAPTRLDVNLVLSGKGEVMVGPLKLVQYPDSFGIADVMRQELYSYGWWTLGTGWKAMEAGVPLILGLACVTGWLAHKGKARRFVMAATGVCATLGVVGALAAVAAVAAGQPWWVWLPAGFLGVVLLAIFPWQMWRYRRRYGALELRRVASMDQLRV